MKKRNVTVTIDKAKEWFSSGNATLKEIALQAFREEELTWHYSQIKTLEDACKALGLNYDIISIVAKDVATFSKASAAMFKLNIIRKALNFGYNLHLVKNAGDSDLYYPVNLFITKSCTFYKSELESGKIEIIGKIKSEENKYYVIGNNADIRRYDGVGCFSEYYGIGSANANVGFVGCANEEIAKHFSKYFGMLIMEAMYADIVYFEIVKEKYKI